MLEDTEIYILPHSNVWHADLNCLMEEPTVDKPSVDVKRAEPAQSTLGWRTTTSQNDPRASTPPGARRIGERAAARVRGSYEDDINSL